MNKKFFIFLIFFWSMIFPQLSLNTFTTDIINNDTSYNDLTDTNSLIQVLENAEFDLWIQFNHKQ